MTAPVYSLPVVDFSGCIALLFDVTQKVFAVFIGEGEFLLTQCKPAFQKLTPDTVVALAYLPPGHNFTALLPDWHTAQNLTMSVPLAIKNHAFWHDIAKCRQLAEYLPDIMQNRTREFYLAFASQDCRALELIPSDLPPALRREIEAESLMRGSCALRFVKQNPADENDRKILEEMICAVLRRDPAALQYLQHPSYNMCRIAIEENGMLLEHIPREYHDQRMILRALVAIFRKYTPQIRQWQEFLELLSAPGVLLGGPISDETLSRYGL